jgi:hypothetical protein
MIEILGSDHASQSTGASSTTTVQESLKQTEAQKYGNAESIRKELRHRAAIGST